MKECIPVGNRVALIVDMYIYIETNLKVQCLVSVSKVLALVDQENTVQIMEVIECSKGGKRFC